MYCNYITTGHADISGWGYTKSGGPSDTLKVAQVPLVDRASCAEIFRDVRSKITENMICAGGAGSDSSKGDSGGPLTCVRTGVDGEEERYLCGIISWGVTSNARETDFPGVYTDVSKYTGRIQKLMRTWWSHYWSKVDYFDRT